MSESLLHGKFVLVIEDQPFIAADVQSSLEEMGASLVRIADSARSAKQTLAGTEIIDLAILDLHLKDGDASHLIGTLSDRGIPILVMTGGPLSDRSPDLGRVATILEKPFSGRDFVMALEQIFDR